MTPSWIPKQSTRGISKGVFLLLHWWRGEGPQQGRRKVSKSERAVGQGFLSAHQREAPNICHFPSDPGSSLDAKFPRCLPQTTLRAPTGVRRPCSCRLSFLWAWPAQLSRRGHRKQSCRSLEPASSSSARCGTGSPRHRSWSTHSTGSFPTSTNSPQKRKHKAKPT